MHLLPYCMLLYVCLGCTRDMEGTAGGRLGGARRRARAFPRAAVHDKIVADGLAPLRYTDDAGNATEVYPFNPDGSPEGIAALCSENGRHPRDDDAPPGALLHLMWQFPLGRRSP